MFAFHRLLVPVDFGEVSHAAIASACDLAERMSGEIVLVHVVPPAAVLPPLERVPVPMNDVDEGSQAERQLEQLPEAGTYRQLVAERHVLHGDPAEVIADFAGKHDIDTIVMGTQSRSGISERLLGSVTESVVQNAPCPVLTVPSKVAAYSSVRSE